MSLPTVFVVEDDQAVRKSLVWILERGGFQVEAFSTPSALLSTYDATRPGCLVLDLCLPEMDGLELRRRLVEMGCMHPFVIISGHGEIPDATRAMRMGAVDFIEKPLDRKAFISRVKEAIERDRASRRDQAEREDFQAKLDSLTPREREVLELVIAGKLTKQIASQLDIAIKTVEVHRSNIVKKMRVDSLVQLVRAVTEHLASQAGDSLTTPEQHTG